MKAWLTISVLCLAGSATFELSAWKTYLLEVDPALPRTSAASSKICWFFDIAQTCSGEAISTLLELSGATNIPNWTPTTATCDSLLNGQRIYAEKVAASLFASSILSAAAAGMTDYELMVQSWVLRVGYFQLKVNDEAFVDVLNDVSDWTTVICAGTNLLHDGATIPLPAFVGTKDCGILASANCASSTCALGPAARCCGDDRTSACCQGALPTACWISGCDSRFEEPCCEDDCGKTCCAESAAYNYICT
jgi:hypothetical protein